MSEPMITIKKADGTFAKVPLSEFKKMQAQTAPKPQEPAVSAKPVAPQQPAQHHAPVHHKPAHKPDHHQSAHHTTKHHPVHVKEEKKQNHSTPHHAQPMNRVDASSPLEEKLKIKSSAPLFSPKREKQVEEVMVELGFSVAPEVSGRLKSLVLARLKDIKSEDETRELLARSIKNGGLGLTEQQVEKIIKSCQKAEGGGVQKEVEVPVLKGKMSTAPVIGNSFSATLQNLESELELPAPKARPSVSPKQEVVSKIVSSSMANEPVFKIDTRPAIKQSMQDVSASTVEMGPVEEIKSMTLTDFRRLSGNPDEAAKRLQQKMFNLQEESFVWYLEALAAYHTSPLYTEYMQAVCQSLVERKSLANVLSMKNSIKLNEAMALIEMEKGL
jgi:hypothetical protein